MTPESGVDLAIDLAGAVLATIWHGSALGLAIAAVLVVWRVEGMRSRERARDELTIVRVVNAQVLHLVWRHLYLEQAALWTIPGCGIGLAAVFSVPAEQQTKLLCPVLQKLGQ